MIEFEGYDVKIFTDGVEEAAVEQLRVLVGMEAFVGCKIRVMPDVHAGAGCVIGFTGDLGAKVIPNVVGVDIGCGMRVMRLGGVGDIDFHALHAHILANVPSGRDVCETPVAEGDAGAALVEELRCAGELKDPDRIRRSLGSLGGGNHFIELGRDGDGRLYVVIHTGSRNLGKQVADLYQGLIPPGGAWLEGDARGDYLHDMRLCQRWAELNREAIGRRLLEFFGDAAVEDEFESVHNYISDDNMIRKGAISARRGERCIIPLNMRDGSLICTGRGNADWNCSAPHGAGRVLSRSQARKTVDMADFEAAMEGIYSECVSEFTRDESPMAYKPAAEIIANIAPTVDIEAVVKPVFNFKASK